ncbi:DUF934 domain-containing protein [Methylocystis sp. MJC1]|jgi:uncharacterized protein (DUF934 family)|uniref:DUF934 domain-containing protein n=1 Tax=Methylocystis sp. MJC1 TaxID=2654282 RepID=UPI0013EA38CF|nr:DUF934 domain-containing protein [Methylocystis sp. MJC1]KAF2990573.1 hypothetical protein MJC1_02335 [Methylocystis sp. MJC1]MBU6525766.1 DUF934 domain-containing protein [Methylocystis sp. MJC1]UZX12233.1 DUF934 domain-containing protein [Methylocystis sp. MJC1]
MALISEGRFIEDAWRRLADEEALPRSGKVIVSLARLEHAVAHLEAGVALGVLAPNTTEPEALAAALPRLSLISIVFPAFADGRGFSLARLIRRAGFTGELRASGRLLADQYRHALGCGFDTIEIPDDLAERQDESQWQAERAAHARTYQRGFVAPGSILEARRKAAAK